ncbi:MAG TPA: hypothetical protein PLR07_15185, partial [Promineifilum sp.]|nr:hypothetical protein [Promineifilum sp.]
LQNRLATTLPHLLESDCPARFPVRLQSATLCDIILSAMIRNLFVFVSDCSANPPTPPMRRRLAHVC